MRITLSFRRFKTERAEVHDEGPPFVVAFPLFFALIYDSKFDCRLAVTLAVYGCISDFERSLSIE